MPYKDWEQAFASHVVPHGQEREARLWNLTHETRVSKVRGVFRRKLGKVIDEGLQGGESPDNAARNAFGAMAGETQAPDSKWLGHIPSPAGAAYPAQAVTFVDTAEIRKRYQSANVLVGGNPLPRVRLPRPLKSKDAPGPPWEPARRFSKGMAASPPGPTRPR